MAEKRTKGQAMVATKHYRVNLRINSNIPTYNGGGGGGPLKFIISSHEVSYVHIFVG